MREVPGVSAVSGARVLRRIDRGRGDARARHRCSPHRGVDHSRRDAVGAEDQARKLNRTENRPPIPPGDPDFERLFPRRNDAESINRHLDDTMWLGRAHSIGHARQLLNLLGLSLALLGRAVVLPLVGALMAAVLLLVIFDLDRPHRGFIDVPSTPLVSERASMVPPPAAVGPRMPFPVKNALPRNDTRGRATRAVRRSPDPLHAERQLWRPHATACHRGTAHACWALISDFAAVAQSQVQQIQTLSSEGSILRGTRFGPESSWSADYPPPPLPARHMTRKCSTATNANASRWGCLRVEQHLARGHVEFSEAHREYVRPSVSTIRRRPRANGSPRGCWRSLCPRCTSCRSALLRDPSTHPWSARVCDKQLHQTLCPSISERNGPPPDMSASPRVTRIVKPTRFCHRPRPLHPTVRDEPGAIARGLGRCNGALCRPKNGAASNRQTSRTGSLFHLSSPWLESLAVSAGIHTQPKQDTDRRFPGRDRSPPLWSVYAATHLNMLSLDQNIGANSFYSREPCVLVASPVTSNFTRRRTNRPVLESPPRQLGVE